MHESSPALPRPRRRLNLAALLARLTPAKRIELGKGALPPTVRKSRRPEADDD